jgi:ferredoxin-NADP reductase
MSVLQAFVHTMRHEADGVMGVELRPVGGGGEFPAFDAGAHIDLHLGNGLIRNYSLVNPPTERGRYVIGVLRDRASRGGSRYVHETLRVGARLDISAPRNNFPLHEDAPYTVLVAGGIGITPILCMARRLQALGKPSELMLFARSRSSAAFVDELHALGVPLTLHFDDEQGGPPDLRKLLARCEHGSRAHYYACGPAVMLDTFEQVCAGLGYGNAHIERFAPVEVKAASDARANYSVELKRSGRVIEIAPGRSLLQTLLDGGVAVEYSCGEGVCGTCETRVLEGMPDHRDSVLSASERAGNRCMMVCVSGCKSERLVLDL